MSTPGPRVDFRENSCLREVQCCDVGCIREAVGSGKYCSGKTTAWASVYGPAAPRYARFERHDRGSLDVDLTFLGEQAGQKETLEKEGKLFLLNTLEQALQMIEFPRMLILIKVCVVRNDGSGFATAMNACVLSLLDACLPMYFMPVSKLL
jgi:ribonuclease PH